MKRSIHFGLNHLNAAAYGGFSGWLAGCQNDAAALLDLATSNGFEADAWFDDDCTADNFVIEVRRLSYLSYPGDTVILTYSGHGGQVRASGEADGLSETFCFYDQQLTDKEFGYLLKEFRAGVNVLCVLDNCYAGGLDKSMLIPRVLPNAVISKLAYDPYSLPMLREPPKEQASIAIFAACQEKEVAFDSPQFGRWTDSLLEAWKSHYTTQEWFNSAETICQLKTAKRQNPSLKIVGDSSILQAIPFGS